MANTVYKMIELTGTSPIGIDDAVQSAVTRAAATVRNMQWFEIVEIRGRVNEDKVGQWQVTLKIGFTIEE
jgi:flavin-binding protein dodecin